MLAAPCQVCRCPGHWPGAADNGAVYLLVRPSAAALGDLVREQRHWQPQRGAGFTIVPDEPVTLGLTFALVVPLPVGYVTGAGRVIYVTEQPQCYGFAYGTLPAHPEQGEEAFHVARDGGRLVCSVAAFSRPRHPAARLGGPVTRALQVRANRSYLRAMRRAAAPEPP